ncbi:MAG TPA: acyl-CoA dehydrogenase family protein [Bacillales bacterium]|nr:acyl-CoA dehydrogenase family protein [Bacillales bacterium]
MISFQPTEDESAFVDVAKEFANEQIRPKARECEENRTVSAEIVKKIEELGFSGLELPESWGGLELPLISQVQMLQALSYGDLGVVQGLPGAGDAASLIRLDPENPAFESYKKAGEKGTWPTVAFLDATDTQAPWNEVEVGSSENGYTLRGTSEPIRLATSAEYVAVAVADAEGETVIFWLDNGWHAAEGDYRLGLLAAGCARVVFEGEEITGNQVVARGEAAHELLSKANARIRVLQAAKEVGLMEAALNYVVEYTAGRKAFGQEIAKFQGVSFTVAEMEIQTRAAHHLVWQAAAKLDGEASDANGASLQALSRAHRSVRFVTDSGVQMLGGHGFVQEFPVEKWMRDAQAQVALYGRERNLTVRRGEEILSGAKEEVAQ